MKEHQLYICRHGSTNLNHHGGSDDRIRGWLDVKLDTEGKKEADEAGKKLKDCNIVRLVCSDLKRSVQTAEEISQEIGVIPSKSDKYKPWHLGSLQGTNSKSAQPEIEEYVKNKPTTNVKGGGESFNEFKHRVLGAICELIKKTHKEKGNTCLVTHYRDVVLLLAWLEDGKHSTTDKNDYDIDEDCFLKHHTELAPGSIICLDCSGDTLPKKPEIMK